MSVTCLPNSERLSVDAVLEMAKQNGYCDVVVIGIDSEGGIALQSSDNETPVIYWWLMRAARFMLRQTRRLDP